MDTDDPTGRSSIAHPHRASRARLGLAGAGLAAALTLSACSGISLPTGDGGQVNLDLDGDGGSLTVTDEDGNEQNIDIETDDDSFAITDGDGNNIMSGGGGTEVPEDFPSDIRCPTASCSSPRASPWTVATTGR
ncbi:hypothetical protein [Serinibacter salmoneus]|uniref:Uncharacterized protein n=1 Tax=Serinibacter salmoneus TaxID=556530 RepID=A0A2A9D509_9MICO|nr:hypothetical protein [Serinibacter salmoneus]PFG21335.1 hypothetical protein ATL40_2964 [Serinibacter salmoneus]